MSCIDSRAASTALVCVCPGAVFRSGIVTLFLLAAALVVALPAWSAPAFVQVAATTPQSAQSSVALKFQVAQTAGNLNVIVVGWTGSSAHVTGVTDSAGNAYALAVGPTVQSGVESAAIYYAMNIAAAAANTVTVKFDSPAPYVDLRISEYSGVAGAGALDGVAGASGNGPTANSGTLTTVGSQDLLVAADYVATSTTGAGPGFTARIFTSPDGDILEDGIAATAGKYSAGAAIGPVGSWIMQAAAFKATSAGGGSGQSTADGQPPTAPTQLQASAASTAAIDLTWQASTDNVGVAAYLLERCTGAGCSNFVQIASVSGTSYTDAGLSAGITYEYRVRSRDTAGNLSAYSATASATTGAATVAPLGYVQGIATTPQNPQTSVTLAYGQAQSAGNANVIAIGWSDQTSHVLSVTDTNGNTYNLAVGPAGGAAGSIAIYVASNIIAANAGSNKVTVTFDAAVPYPDLRIAEYRGIDPQHPLDTGAAASGSGYTSASPQIVTSTAGDLLVGANYVATTTNHSGAGYTTRLVTNPDGDILEDETAASAGTYNASAALSPAGPWVMAVAALHAAGSVSGGGSSGGSAPPPPPPVVSITARPTSVASGGSSTLTWSTSGATSCAASGSWSGAVATSGSQTTGALTQNATYTLTCGGSGGTATASASVSVGAATDAASDLVQHVSSSNVRGNDFGSPYCYYFQLPNPTTAGNAVIVGFTYHGNPAPSVTDDKGDSYTIAARYYDSADGQSAGIAAAFNIAAGARSLSLCFSSDPGGWVQPMASELANVVGIDGAGSGGNGTGTAARAGTLTPSRSGDVVYQVVASLSWSQSSFSAGSQANVGWELLSADLLDGWAGQYGVYNSTSALQPSLTLGHSDNWVAAAVLLKSGSAGGIPSGLRVVHLLHENVPYHPQSGGTYMPFQNPLQVQLPCDGNLLVAMVGGGNNPESVTAVTDSNQNAWRQAGQNYTDADNLVQAYYAGNAACSADLSLAMRWTGTEGDFTILFYDIAGAASSPLDRVVGGGGDGPNPGSYTMPFGITPSTAKEIVLAEIMWDYNTAVGLSGGYFDGNRFSGENIDGPEPIDENNGWGHIITTSTNQVGLTWQVLQPNSDPIRAWAGMAVAFKGAP